MFTIQDAAAHIGVAPSTLRYYDKEGLLPFVRRSSSGIRMFQETDFDWLRLIECLKATGMSIREIKRFIDLYAEGDATLAQRRDMFYQRKQAVEAQMETLNKTLDFISYKCWYYDTAAAAGCEAVLQGMRPEEVPEDIRTLNARAGVS